LTTFRLHFLLSGSELSGVVVEVGEGVEGFKKGDRVLSFPTGGGAFSQYCMIDPGVSTPYILLFYFLFDFLMYSKDKKTTT
jgi:NADPH:quinone reductase-like Zn-dependent oxidoreductase